MGDNDLDDLGPVDYLVIDFPEGQQNFTGEVAAELVKLADAGTIRLIDALVITKDEEGDIDALEVAADDLGPLVGLEAQLAELLAAEDLAELALVLQPGDVAGVVVYENLWAAPFAAATRRAGGQLIANGRIPIQAIIAALGAGDEDESDTPA